MQIRGIAGSLSDLIAAAKQGDPAEAAAVSTAGSPSTGSASAAPRLMSKILSRYDVTDISPDQFSQMLKELFESGTLSQEELQELAAVRTDLDNAGVDADESIDLLEFYSERIQKEQRQLSDADEPANGQSMGPLLGRLNWLEKFALIQAAPDAIGLNAMA